MKKLVWGMLLSQVVISHSHALSDLNSPSTSEALEDDTSCLPQVLVKRSRNKDTYTRTHTYLSGLLPSVVREHKAGADLEGSFIAGGLCLSFTSPTSVHHVTNPGWDSQPLVMFFSRLAHCFHFYYLTAGESGGFEPLFSAANKHPVNY